MFEAQNGINSQIHMTWKKVINCCHLIYVRSQMLSQQNLMLRTSSRSYFTGRDTLCSQWINATALNDLSLNQVICFQGTSQLSARAAFQGSHIWNKKKIQKLSVVVKRKVWGLSSDFQPPMLKAAWYYLWRCDIFTYFIGFCFYIRINI